MHKHVNREREREREAACKARALKKKKAKEVKKAKKIKKRKERQKKERKNRAPNKSLISFNRSRHSVQAIKSGDTSRKTRKANKILPQITLTLIQRSRITRA